jgi:hypothetical protein
MASLGSSEIDDRGIRSLASLGSSEVDDMTNALACVFVTLVLSPQSEDKQLPMIVKMIVGSPEKVGSSSFVPSSFVSTLIRFWEV